MIKLQRSKTQIDFNRGPLLEAFIQTLWMCQRQIIVIFLLTDGYNSQVSLSQPPPSSTWISLWLRLIYPAQNIANQGSPWYRCWSHFLQLWPTPLTLTEHLWVFWNNTGRWWTEFAGGRLAGQKDRSSRAQEALLPLQRHSRLGKHHKGEYQLHQVWFEEESKQQQITHSMAIILITQATYCPNWRNQRWGYWGQQHVDDHHSRCPFCPLIHNWLLKFLAQWCWHLIAGHTLVLEAPSLEVKCQWMLIIYFAINRVPSKQPDKPRSGTKSSDFVINAGEAASRSSSEAVERLFRRFERRPPANPKAQENV